KAAEVQGASRRAGALVISSSPRIEQNVCGALQHIVVALGPRRRFRRFSTSLEVMFLSSSMLSMSHSPNRLFCVLGRLVHFFVSAPQEGVEFGCFLADLVEATVNGRALIAQVFTNCIFALVN